MSRIESFALMILFFIAGGCGGGERTTDRTDLKTETPPTVESNLAAEETNTATNERDREGALPTPLDQSNNEADLRITQQIRQAIVNDAALSMTADNVKIITVGGKVTLRGPVKTQAEKEAIVAKAQQVAGTTQVEDQLEVMGGTGG
jgi:osmotically-inducible protein OsmY